MESMHPITVIQKILEKVDLKYDNMVLRNFLLRELPKYYEKVYYLDNRYLYCNKPKFGTKKEVSLIYIRSAPDKDVINTFLNDTYNHTSGMQSGTYNRIIVCRNWNDRQKELMRLYYIDCVYPRNKDGKTVWHANLNKR